MSFSAHGISTLLLWRSIAQTEESSTPAAEWRGSLYEDWWKELQSDFSFTSALSFADRDNERESIPSGMVVHSLGYRGESFFYAHCGILLKDNFGKEAAWSKYASLVNCSLCIQGMEY